MRKPSTTVLLAVVLSVGQAAAQTEAVVTNIPLPTAFTGPPLSAGIDLERRQLTWTSPGLAGDVVVTSDGRFAIWSGSAFDAQSQVSTYHVDIRDVLTGAITRVPAPALVYRLLAHPRRFQIFALIDRAPIQAIDGNGRRNVDACTAPADATLTLDGRLLFALCDNQVAVVATDTLQVVRLLSLPSSALRIAVNSDGSRFAIARDVVTDTDAALMLIDGLTGVVIAMAPPPPRAGSDWSRSLTMLQADLDRTRLFISFRQTRHQPPPPGFQNTGSTVAYSFSDLNQLGTFPPPPFSPGFLNSLSFSPDGMKAIAGQSYVIQSPISTLFLIDPITLATDYSHFGSGPTPRIAIAAPPLAPTSVTATVNSNTVTLAWDLPLHSPMATRYLVDARLSASGPVAATLTTTENILTIPGVPPGAYYVTVRGENYRGAGTVSVPTQVIVQ